MLTATFSESIIQLFTGDARSSAFGNDLCFVRHDESNPFLGPDDSYSEIDANAISPKGCDAFFDVILALEHEAARLQLNLLAVTLERALDACLTERKRLYRSDPPFHSGPPQSGSQNPQSRNEGMIAFRSIRAA
jgi:hypothetical protein